MGLKLGLLLTVLSQRLPHPNAPVARVPLCDVTDCLKWCPSGSRGAPAQQCEP